MKSASKLEHLSPKSSAPQVERSWTRVAAAKAKVWFDLDNTPHVPFFEPIIEELEARGFPVLVSARDAFQVCELADEKGLRYTKIGRHYGKNRVLKIWGLLFRAMQMMPFALRGKPGLAVSHCSRSQLLLGALLRIPTLLLDDYEHSHQKLMWPTWVLAPSVIPDSALSYKGSHLLKYPGIKEDAYAWKLKPDSRILQQLGLADSDVVVTVRPPATEAHYHNQDSDKLFLTFMERACQAAGVRVVLVPRNKAQAENLRRQSPGWFEAGKTVIPSHVVDGLNLIWHSDLVVSGGGTMNREAAALGVPVYSTFRGSIGAVDKHLAATGRLIMIESVEDVHRKVSLLKRPRRSIAEATSKETLHSIVDIIERIMQGRDDAAVAR
jgi:predicted glycosyltransferase